MADLNRPVERESKKVSYQRRLGSPTVAQKYKLGYTRVRHIKKQSSKIFSQTGSVVPGHCGGSGRFSTSTVALNDQYGYEGIEFVTPSKPKFAHSLPVTKVICTV